MSIKTNLGPATAYGEAVANGYQGTKEEFGQNMADFAGAANQVALDRAAVEKAKKSVDESQADVTRKQESVTQSEMNVNESRTHIDREIAAFDAHIEEKTQEAKSAIDTTEKAATDNVKIQETASVENVKNQTSAYITEQEKFAKQNITDHVNTEIDRANEAMSQAKQTLNGTINTAIYAKQALADVIDTAAQKKTELDTSNTAAAETIGVTRKLKNDLDESRRAAENTKTALDESDSAAKQTKTALDASNDTASKLNTNLTEKIAEGNQLKTDLPSLSAKEAKKVTDEATKQMGLLSAEGKKQLDAVNIAAQEILLDRQQINTNKKDISDLKTSTYTDTFFRNFFAMQRTGKKYTVRFPLWETSQVATGEKLDDNTGLIVEASTITEKGRDDYETIPLFRTYDCNVEKIDGKLKITAMKGDVGFDPKEKDTFVLGMPYYHKAWEQDGYLYYSRSDTPHEGYVLCPEARKTDGMRNLCLYGKYIAGRNSQETLGSYYGVNPTRNLPSCNNNVTEAKKRGDEYCFGSSYDYAYIQTTFLLKYANKNWNNVLGGCFAYSYQYLVSVPESNTKRVVLKKSEADKFLIGSCVLVGDSGDASKAPDRSDAKAYNLCDSAKILDIVEVDENNKALVLDAADAITTTATTWVSSIHWESGFSDDILGRDGCPCQTKSQISSMLYPSVIQGIELMVGGYEVPGNTFMDIVDGLTRDVYVCTDSTKLTTNVTTAKETYVKLAKQMTVERNNEWNYGTEIFIDTENGMNIITKAGASGSGTNTGFCDGIYFDTATSGQREFRLLGHLWSGGTCGAFYAYCYSGLGDAGWVVLARLSLSVFRGEFA